MAGLLRLSGSRGSASSQVSGGPAAADPPAPPGVPGAVRGAVGPASPVPGSPPAGRDADSLPGSGPLSGHTGSEVPLQPTSEQACEPGAPAAQR